ncbi:PKD domain-containing protein [Streptomyces sp. LamerLS-31b]|uniref:PKD domain-containing protein n=1 Tax=Streptomyces sp. LamerLS-31b TaxID=1839765 RepID=UPI001EFBB9F4|nr:PKD domain-containing protein [Streptomyces sp. LamerLS-31b]
MRTDDATTSWGKPIATYAVDFGDGSAPVTQAPGAPITHSYTTPGVYAPVVTVTDADGSSRTVRPAAVDAGTTAAPATSLSGALATNTDGQVDAGDAVFTVPQPANAWEVAHRVLTFGDGDQENLADGPQKIEHQYPAAGSYTATADADRSARPHHHRQGDRARRGRLPARRRSVRRRADDPRPRGAEAPRGHRARRLRRCGRGAPASRRQRCQGERHPHPLHRRHHPAGHIDRHVRSRPDGQQRGDGEGHPHRCDRPLQQRLRPSDRQRRHARPPVARAVRPHLPSRRAGPPARHPQRHRRPHRGGRRWSLAHPDRRGHPRRPGPGGRGGAQRGGDHHQGVRQPHGVARGYRQLRCERPLLDHGADRLRADRRAHGLVGQRQGRTPQQQQVLGEPRRGRGRLVRPNRERVDLPAGRSRTDPQHPYGNRREGRQARRPRHAQAQGHRRPRGTGERGERGRPQSHRAFAHRQRLPRRLRRRHHPAGRALGRLHQRTSRGRCRSGQGGHGRRDRPVQRRRHRRRRRHRSPRRLHPRYRGLTA